MLKASRLLRPVLFLCIQSEGLWKYRWGYPFGWLVVLSLYLFFFPGTLSGKIAILDKITVSCCNILTILPGFYIAALAAIATFQAETMDTPLEGHKAYLCSREGEEKKHNLTRRRFLCLLFGYLSFLSLVLYLTNTIFKAAPLSVFLSRVRPGMEVFGELLLTGLTWLFFMQLICLTLLALFYLGDRIHWKNSIFKT